MPLQLTPELAHTVQGFLNAGRFQNDEEVLREALAALRRQEDELAEILEGIEDETAGRTRPWAEVKTELHAKYGMAE